MHFTKYFSSGVSTSATYNEADLLARVAKGEEEAFRMIFQQYFRPLCFFAQSIIEEMEPSRDLAQDALYKLWDRRLHFNTLGNIKAFLYITTKNACINYLKAEQRRTARHQEVARQMEIDDGRIEVLITKEELLQQILLEVDSLPEKYGSVIKLAFMEGLSHQQISDRLSIPAATVRKQKERGLKLLQNTILKRKLASIIALLWMACFGRSA